MVHRIHSIVRTLIFPFYSVYEVAAFVVVESLLAATSVIILGSIKLGVLVAGFLGWMMVAASTAPSVSRIKSDKIEDATNILKNLRYEYDHEKRYWIPILPKLLFWKYNRVELIENGEWIKVFGPRNILEELTSLT